MRRQASTDYPLRSSNGSGCLCDPLPETSSGFHCYQHSILSSNCRCPNGSTRTNIHTSTLRQVAPLGRVQGKHVLLRDCEYIVARTASCPTQIIAAPIPNKQPPSSAVAQIPRTLGRPVQKYAKMPRSASMNPNCVIIPIMVWHRVSTVTIACSLATASSGVASASLSA